LRLAAHTNLVFTVGMVRPSATGAFGLLSSARVRWEAELVRRPKDEIPSATEEAEDAEVLKVALWWIPVPV
jgi:hypothetical protein